MKKTLRAQFDREARHSPAAHAILQPRSGVGLIDHRPEAIAQRQLAEAIHTSPVMVAQRQRLGRMFGTAAQLTGPEDEELQMKAAPAVLQRKGPEKEELLQGKFQPAQRRASEEEELLQGMFQPVQREAGLEEDGLLQGKFVGRAKPVQLQSDLSTQENRTGMPDNLKSGIESLSGMSLDHVKVHYNSAQPAQLNALAYAQGSDIHVAPGQEQHLPHEAWHVVQQAQGRVQPTMQMQDGVPINDDAGLEQEANVMGMKASQMRRPEETAKGAVDKAGRAFQRAGGMGDASQELGRTRRTSGEHGESNSLHIPEDAIVQATGYRTTADRNRYRYAGQIDVTEGADDVSLSGTLKNPQQKDKKVDGRVYTPSYYVADDRQISPAQSRDRGRWERFLKPDNALRVQNLTANPRGMNLGQILTYHVAQIAISAGKPYVIAMSVSDARSPFYVPLGFADYNGSRPWQELKLQRDTIDEYLRSDASRQASEEEQQRALSLRQSLTDEMSNSSMIIGSRDLATNSKNKSDQIWGEYTPKAI